MAQEYGSDIYVPRYGYGYGGGGGGTAGQMWNQALSGVGQNIADAINRYHQQHVQYDQAYQTADALSRLGINDSGDLVPTVDQDGKKVQGVQPIVNPAALEAYQARNAQDRAGAMGAISALTKLGVATAQQQQKSREGPLFFTDPTTGETIARWGGQTVKLGGAQSRSTKAIQTPEDKQIASTTASLNNTLGPTGVTVPDFAGLDHSQVAFQSPEGTTIPDLTTAQSDPKNQVVLPLPAGAKKMSVKDYSNALGRLNQIKQLQVQKQANTGPNGPAQGGYMVGRTYGNMQYLGGDPKVASSWNVQGQ